MMGMTRKIAGAGITAALVLSMAMAATVNTCTAELDESGTDNKTIQITVGRGWIGGYDEESGEYLCSSRYPKIFVGGDEREQYPALQKAFEELNARWDSEANERYNSEYEAAKEDIAAGTFVGTHTDEAKLFVLRADQHALSLLKSEFIFSGGNHGSTVYECAVIDPADGAAIAFGDVVTDAEAFSRVLMETLKADYPECDWEENAGIFEAEKLGDLHWTLGYDGITVYFGSYEAGSYAAGCPVAHIPFAGNEAMFNESFFDVPDSYGISFPDTERFFFDINGDGTAEQLSIMASGDDQDAYTTLTVSVGDKRNEFESYFFGYEANLEVHGGRTTLIVDEKSENDYNFATTYDLSTGEAVLVEEGIYGYASEFMTLEDDSIDAAEYVPTDPEAIRLRTSVQTLGSASAYKDFRLDETGKFVPVDESKWFELSLPRILVLKQDLTAQIVDEEGNNVGTETVAAGAEVLYSRCDAGKSADVKLDDGRYARITLDDNEDSWVRTIDGVDISDIFDGIVFSG